jgi:hypothetical protein
MANIVLKTFAAGDDGQGTVTPQDDALIYQNAIPMNGIFSGATVTLSEANVLHVAAGFGIIGGRFFEINESDVTVELSSSGTLLGRLYIHLELTNADVPISINVATGASLPALVGDPDLNINDGAFDLELATFNVSEVTISDIVNTFPIISKANNQLRRATAYSVNDMVLCQSASDSLIFICTTAGTTAVQQPMGYTTIADGNTIADGTAVFKAVDLIGAIDTASVKADAAQQMIAPIQTTLVALKAYAVGEQFVYNGLLYKATAAIAQGGTITINGNCALADSVTEQIGDLNNYLSMITNSSSNAIKFPNGTMIQANSFHTNAGAYVITVNLNEAFIDKNYSIVIAPIVDPDATYSLSYENQTASTFQFSHTNPIANDYSYIAIGRWK